MKQHSGICIDAGVDWPEFGLYFAAAATPAEEQFAAITLQFTDPLS